MSVPYGFRDLFTVSPLSFTTATFSKPKPHSHHDRNDTIRTKNELTRHYNVVKIIATSSKKGVYRMQ